MSYPDQRIGALAKQGASASYRWTADAPRVAAQFVAQRLAQRLCAATARPG